MNTSVRLSGIFLGFAGSISGRTEPTMVICLSVFVIFAGLLVCMRTKPAALPGRRQPRDLLRAPVLGPILRYRHFRSICQAVLFTLAVAIVVDGFTGPQTASLNLAGVLPWTYWRGFAVISLLVAGNLFCMACPFTFVRNLARRLLPGSLRWPAALRSKWLAIGLLFSYLWANEVFSLWNSPWWTAWIVVGYFIAAFLVNGLFQGASFCKYVCPIGQFHFVNTHISPLEIKVRSSDVCGDCRTQDCISGNANHRGCENYLFQPRKAGNFDCTFCLDCVQACTHGNIGMLATLPGSALLLNRRGAGIRRLTERTDAAALAWAMVFGSLVSAAVMVDPVMKWMHSLDARLGLHSMMPVSTAFLLAGIVLAPLVLSWLCGSASSWLASASAGSGGWQSYARSFAFAMVPLGAGMWVAHFAFHLFTGWQAIIPVASRILHLSASTMTFSAHIPAWLPAAQILVLDAGLALSVYVAWNTARRCIGTTGQAVRLLTPWAVLAIGIYAVAIWILFQPMQMRGIAM